MCSTLIEHILQFLYTIVIENLRLSVLLSYTKASPPLGWGEAVPRKRENQINTLVLKDINFTINIIDCLITERLIP